MTISPTRTYDSFERADDWHCKAADGKMIKEWVCWNDEDPEVPDWCPKRVSKSIERKVDIQPGYEDR